MDKNVSLYSKWKDFCEYTSVHGLIYVYAMPHTSRPTRIIWAIIWLAFFALCTYQSILNVLQYRSYHVKVKTTYSRQQQISFESQMQFPSITFSPITIGKRSEIGAFPLLQAVVASWFAESDKEFKILLNEVG